MENVSIGLAFVAGFLSFVSPCCLPLVPAYIGYMSSRVTHAVASEKVKALPGTRAVMRATMLLHGLAFVAGFTVVFVSIGLMTTAFTSLLGGTVSVLKDIIAQVGGVMIIIFGLHFMGVLRWMFRKAKQHPELLNPVTSMLAALAGSLFILWGFIELPLALPFLAAFLLALLLGGAFAQPQTFWLNLIERLEALLYSDTRGDMQQRRGGLAGSFMMGVIFSAGWTPCIGPLLGTILTLAANTGDALAAVPLLTAYSLGLGIPFLVAALLMDGAKSILRRIQRHVRKIEFFSGALLVVIGVLVTTGELASLSQSLSTKFADFSYRLETCGVGFLEGEIMGDELGACLNGTLVAVAMNQSAAGKLNAELPQMEYVVHVEQAGAYDVEVKGLKGDEALTIQIRDLNGLITQRDNIVAAAASDDSDALIAMTGVRLEPGMHLLVVSRGDPDAEKVDFRIKLRVTPEAAPLNIIPMTSSEGDSAVADLAAQGMVDMTPAPEATGTPPESIASGLTTITDGAAASAPVKGSSLGDRALDFTLLSDTGEPVSLADYSGKVVLLSFWGTWCGPCRREMPEFQDTYEEYADEGFEIIAIAVKDQPEAVQQFREEFGLTFPLVLDEGKRVNDMYAIPGQPGTLILDRDGVIVFQSYSVVMRDDVEAVIKAELE